MSQEDDLKKAISDLEAASKGGDPTLAQALQLAEQALDNHRAELAKEAAQADRGPNGEVLEEIPDLPTTLVPSERMLVKYFDGQRDRQADPVSVYSRIVSKIKEEGGDLEAVFSSIALLTSGSADPTNVDIVTQSNFFLFLSAVHHGFKTQPFDDSGSASAGITEAEAFRNYSNLIHFMLKKNPNTAKSPSFSRSSAGPLPESFSIVATEQPKP
jgi:hypothetical protein